MVLPLLLVLARICTLLMVCSIHQLQANCYDGWFGPKCQFQCHCWYDRCNNSNGECLNNKCHKGYFGPSCQYGELFTFSVTFDHAARPCESMRVFIVTDKILDVVCEITDTFTTITIQGNISSAVCSVYISEGHNVALKEKVSQSSTLGEHIADKAVDGNLDIDLQMCSRTKSTQQSCWQINFSLPNILTRVQIFQPGPQNLTLTASGQIDNDVCSVQIPALGYFPDIKLKWLTKVNSLTICGNSLLGLQLCEVQVFAETWCNNGYHGLLCEDTCTCAPDELCSLINGACGKGCQGSYNYKCKNPCGWNYQSNCQPGSNNCSECLPGYIHLNCSKKCPNSTFGANCSQWCSQGCRDECSSVNGTCTCHSGYYRGICESRTSVHMSPIVKKCILLQECPNGTFGTNCSKRCSQGCKDNVCNHINGTCTCKTGYHGATCDKCPRSTYGDNCSKNCSDDCVKSLCNVTNGHCFNCNSGYTGHSCKTCLPDRHGVNCTYICSEACLLAECDDYTGECLSCPTGYNGTMCAPCRPTTYGVECNSTCSINCLNQECNHITGRCFKCVSDKMGPWCSDSISDKLVQALLIAGYFLGIIPLCFAVKALNSFIFKEKVRRASEYYQRDSSQPGEKSNGSDQFSETETGVTSSGSTYV